MTAAFSFLGGVLIGALLFHLSNRYFWSAGAFFGRLTFYGLAWAVFCGWLFS